MTIHNKNHKVIIQISTVNGKVKYCTVSKVVIPVLYHFALRDIHNYLSMLIMSSRRALGRVLINISFAIYFTN